MEVVLSTEQDKLLGSLYVSVPRARQLSWLQLSDLKLNIEKQIEGKILEIQQALNGWETMDLLALQAATEKANKIVKSIPDLRKSFTGYLDRISDQMMSIQKRAEGMEILSQAVAKELELRLAKEQTDGAVSEKVSEAARFKAHVQNEYVRISSEYEIALSNYINTSYLTALDQNFTDEGLFDHIRKETEWLKNIQRSAPVKFQYTLNTAAELNELHASIPAPNYDDILVGAIGKLVEKFKMYHQDVQNKELAKAQSKKELEQTQDAILNQASKTQAVNTLVSKGASTLVDTLPGAKKVKRKQVIVVQDTSADTIKIISEFLARWDDVAPNLKVKSWSNLSVKQMAAALQELPDQIAGLVYQEVVK
jgi:hypothetical protein